MTYTTDLSLKKRLDILRLKIIKISEWCMFVKLLEPFHIFKHKFVSLRLYDKQT